jgi:predicted DsbA family dithiol-disulfide isomerase
MTEPQERRLAVEIWSDIACPWCYIGKRRLEAALALVPFAEAVTVTFHAFELDPNAPHVYPADPSYAARLAAKYRLPLARAEQMLTEMTERGRGEGIQFDFSALVGVNTFRAHQLMGLARARDESSEAQSDLGLRLNEALFAGYFSQGRNLWDEQTLVEIAGSVGLFESDVGAALHDQVYEAQVREDEAAAQELGITGVPFFIIGKYAVSGAQPADTLRRVLQQAWDETQPSV